MGGTVQELTVTVTTPGTAVQLSTESRRVGLLAVKAKRASGGNVGTVYVGVSTVDKDTNQLIDLLPGDYLEPNFVRGESIDLSELWIDADNASDGITGWVQGA